jgi:hypothetical protein
MNAGGKTSLSTHPGSDLQSRLLDAQQVLERHRVLGVLKVQLVLVRHLHCLLQEI